MEEHSSDNDMSEDEKKLLSPKQNGQENLEEYSTEVREIIGRSPHWLVRGGISGFLAVLVLVFIAASVIEYPEVIDAPLRLRAFNDPKTLESKINGKLVKLIYENNTYVEKGQVLAWLESTADHRAVLELSAEVDRLYRWLRQDTLRRIRSVEIARFSDLGELQSDFQAFEQIYREYLTYLPGGFYSQKRLMISRELTYTRQLLEKLKEQKKIQETNLKLSRREYEAQKKLAEKDLVARMDLARAESEVAGSRLPLEQTESAIINNYLSQTAKEQELMELDKQIAEQKAVFRQALNILKSAIARWKSDYLLIAPVSGTLVYAGIIQENQTVKSGREIAYIQPDNTRFFGEMAIAQQSFGKIREGQQVLVRFSGYPDQEFGTVTGEIDYLSEFPVRDSVFLAKVDFPQGLTTNYGRDLPPANGMTGKAEIITQDMKLLERIYNNLTKELR